MLKRRERITHIWRPAKRLTFLLFSPHHRTGRCNNSCIFAKLTGMRRALGTLITDGRQMASVPLARDPPNDCSAI